MPINSIKGMNSNNNKIQHANLTKANAFEGGKTTELIQPESFNLDIFNKVAMVNVECDGKSADEIAGQIILSKMLIDHNAINEAKFNNLKNSLASEIEKIPEDVREKVLRQVLLNSNTENMSTEEFFIRYIKELNDISNEVEKLKMSKIDEILEKKLDSIVKDAEDIANDQTHGYSQANRYGDDYDCSSFVAKVLMDEGFDTNIIDWDGSITGTNFTTYSAPDKLKKLGFEEMSFDPSTLKKGDVLWRDGHIEFYYGDGRTVGAHTDENGSSAPGDQGTEISVTNYLGNYSRVYRYTGEGMDLSGIPSSDLYIEAVSNKVQHA